jgi:hypothetical protein
MGNPNHQKRTEVFERCLDAEKNYIKVVGTALVPIVTVILVLLLRRHFMPFVIVTPKSIVASLKTWQMRGTCRACARGRRHMNTTTS